MNRNMSYNDEESPESPPSYERSSSYMDPTKIRVETDDLSSLRFSIDCVGRLNYANSERSDGSEAENVGPSSGRPSILRPSILRPSRLSGLVDTDYRSVGYSTGSSLDVDYRRPSIDHTSQDRDYRTETRPLYNIESDMVIAGISSQRSESGIGVGSRDDGRSPAPPRPKNCCWNCQGDHMINECPQPKDGKRISMNRKIFMAAKGTRNNFPGGRQKRYHEEQTSRIGQPGIISPELRYAMELERQEVPIHVYRMRLYGYPPGWLDNAMEEASSGLKLYGDSITMSVGNRKEPRINPESIISYPGFNEPMPFGEVDRGPEFGCPRYRLDDSIDNMLRKLNSQNLVIDGDGIVSQSSHQEEPWGSLSGLDRPLLNDGASRGIGRGRYIETTLPRHLQPGRGVSSASGRPRSPVYRERIDRECRPMRDKPVVIPQDVDERYLPTHKSGAQKRARHNSRSASPSLLRDGEELDDIRIPQQASTIPDRMSAASPVILNLPPIPGNSRSRGAAARASDAGDETGGSATGSSNDFPSSPTPKRRKKQQQRQRQEPSDDEVMIITDDKNEESPVEYDSDCLVIDTDGEPSPVKSTHSKSSSPRKRPATSTASTPKVPPPEVFQVDSLDSEDWEVDKPTSNTYYKPLASPGSSTGDEETFAPANNAPGKATITPTKPPVPSIRENFDEDWEDDDEDKLVIDEDAMPNESEGSGTQTPNDADGSGTQTPNPTDGSGSNINQGEFIPPNAQIEAIKDVFLANLEEDPDENEKSFSTLPDFDKFARGMPVMVFEEDPPERTGRLDKVLQVLKTRKSGGNL